MWLIEVILICKCKSQMNSSDASYHKYETYATLKDNLTSNNTPSPPVCLSEDVPGE